MLKKFPLLFLVICFVYGMTSCKEEMKESAAKRMQIKPVVDMLELKARETHSFGRLQLNKLLYLQRKADGL